MKSRTVSKGKMIASIVGICVATLLVIFAFSGRYAQGGFRHFGNFFLGTFGMSFYGMMAAVIVICSFVLAGKSLKVPVRYAVFFVLTFVAIVLFVHTLTTTYLMSNEFRNDTGTGYVQLVYNYYDNVMGVPTFGGVFFGCICWALTHGLSVWGAMIVIVALLGVSVYFIGDFFYSYFTGKLTLQSAPVRSDIEPSPDTISVSPVTVSPVDDDRERAREVLFGDRPFPDRVTRDVYDVAPQSTLDDPSPKPTTTSSASDILFGSDAEPSQPTDRPSGGNSFFRPVQQEPRQEQPREEGFIVPDGSYGSTTEQHEEASDWKITSDTPADEPQDMADVSPIVVDTVDVDPLPRSDDADSDDVDMADIAEEEDDMSFVEDSYTDDTSDNVGESEEHTEEPQRAEESDSRGDELVPVEGETVIETSAGTAVQTKIDLVPRKELEESQAKIHKYPKYVPPVVDLLNDITIVEDTEADSRARAAEAITNKLAVFGIKVELADTIVGPSVTRYMFNVLSQKTRMNMFASYSDDIKACVEAQDDIRIEAPVQGTNQVGIEVANKVKRPVVLRSIIESDAFKKAKGKLVFAIGQDITGKVIVSDLAEMPHLLIAGATGSGKSVALNCLIVSLMYRYGPEYLRFVMVDPKFVELSRYNGIPHMLTSETITQPADALAGMDYLINEMEARYQLFRKNGVGNIGEYNARINPRLAQKMPYLVFIVDELADLMAASKQAFESKLQRLAQKSRAAGIHIVLATQRPDVKTITGTIKANLPCRMALKVSSPADSVTIINGGGAEKLLGKGDMLFMSPGSAELLRVQGAYVSNDEIRGMVDYTREMNELYYDENISEEIFVSQKQQEEAKAQEEGKDEGKDIDPYCKKALRFWLEKQGGRASIASIQRSLGIGFNRAGRIMDTLQRMGYVETLSPSEPNSKPLRVQITLEELDNIFPELDDEI